MKQINNIIDFFQDTIDLLVNVVTTLHSQRERPSISIVCRHSDSRDDKVLSVRFNLLTNYCLLVPASVDTNHCKDLQSPLLSPLARRSANGLKCIANRNGYIDFIT